MAWYVKLEVHFTLVWVGRRFFLLHQSIALPVFEDVIPRVVIQRDSDRQEGEFA